jgi:uncharacterized protein YunC (DUF1805 family)
LGPTVDERSAEALKELTTKAKEIGINSGNIATR